MKSSLDAEQREKKGVRPPPWPEQEKKKNDRIKEEQGYSRCRNGKELVFEAEESTRKKSAGT